MLRLALFFSLLFGVNTATKAEKNTVYTQPYSEASELMIEQLDLETNLFVKESVDVADLTKLEVVQVEEEIEINFDVYNYLPLGFNPLAGKNDVNWDDLKLIEVEEDVELEFDPHLYLPNGFDPYEGIEIIYYQSLIGL